MVNACRLYLKVTMLSENIAADGTSIQPWAMHGTKQNETALGYPYQPTPPPIAWKAWRDALHHASYLDRHSTDIISPLYRPILVDPPAPSSIRMNHWPATIPTTGMMMKEIIDLLPPEYKQAIGT